MSASFVLVVDDDALVRMNAVFQLEEAGFDTLQAGTADEAIGLLEGRSDIKLVFTDINMPGSMDGLALAHAIRHRWPTVELVVTSGYERVQDKDMPERGLFLGKPYQPAELVRMVQSLSS
jgi:CheY-like chemotaxis protein